MREPNSRRSSAQNAWIVPVFTCAACSPSVRWTRSAISPAALLVKVKAQMRSGGSPSSSSRYRIRSIRQNVLPAPGPASTSSGRAAASIAVRCDSEGMRPGDSGWASVGRMVVMDAES